MTAYGHYSEESWAADNGKGTGQTFALGFPAIIPTFVRRAENPVERSLACAYNQAAGTVEAWLTLTPYQEEMLFVRGEQVIHAIQCPHCGQVHFLALVPTSEATPKGYVVPPGM